MEQPGWVLKEEEDNCMVSIPFGDVRSGQQPRFRDSFTIALCIRHKHPGQQRNATGGDITALAFKSGGVVLDTSQVQVMVPPLCVLIHAVVTALGDGRLAALPSAAKIRKAQTCGCECSLGITEPWNAHSLVLTAARRTSAHLM